MFQTKKSLYPILAILLFAFLPNFIWAQALGIHSDVLDPLGANGASLWLNYDHDKHRVFSATGFNELPDFLNSKSENFSEKRTFFLQLGYAYKLGSKKKFMLGAQMMYKELAVTEKTSEEVQSLDALRICPIIFYEWNFLKALPQLSLTPWASYRIDLLRESADFMPSGLSYQTAEGNFAMGFNLGYTFSLKKK
ncbi:MAG: hypothetical protein MRZ79_23675 [Bacteroidia bacterium]|nr:hypothetical protein [Bacteroidia bacterium]